MFLPSSNAAWRCRRIWHLRNGVGLVRQGWRISITGVTSRGRQRYQGSVTISNPLIIKRKILAMFLKLGSRKPPVFLGFPVTGPGIERDTLSEGVSLYPIFTKR